MEGENEEVKALYIKGLEIRKAIAEETGTAGSRRDLLASYNKLGEISKAKGKLSEAKIYYLQSLKIGDDISSVIKIPSLYEKMEFM